MSSPGGAATTGGSGIDHGSEHDDKETKPWENRMPDSQFSFMRDVLASPSPVGLESAMTRGVLRPYFERHLRPAGWGEHCFLGNDGVVWDSHPECRAPSSSTSKGNENQERPLSVMVCGHADKIRMQVRSIGADGKVYINSDSFLPQTLIGNEVR